MNSYSPVWHVDLRLQSSRYFFTLTCLVHSLAFLAVLSSGLAMPGLIALGLGLMVSLALSCRQERRRAGLVVREQGLEWWVGAAGCEGPATLLGRNVWRYLVVMEFQCAAQGRRWRQRVVVLPDAVSAEDFRRLRVRLRYGCAPAKSASAIQQIRDRTPGGA